MYTAQYSMKKKSVICLSIKQFRAKQSQNLITWSCVDVLFHDVAVSYMSILVLNAFVKLQMGAIGEMIKREMKEKDE